MVVDLKCTMGTERRSLCKLEVVGKDWRTREDWEVNELFGRRNRNIFPKKWETPGIRNKKKNWFGSKKKGSAHTLVVKESWTQQDLTEGWKGREDWGHQPLKKEERTVSSRHRCFTGKTTGGGEHSVPTAKDAHMCRVRIERWKSKVTNG